MHWNNGRFHEDITVGNRVYITDHKHIAISGGYNSITFGESSVDANLYGKNILIKTTASNTSIDIDAVKNLNLKSGTNATIESGTVNVDAGTYLNLKSGTGITVTSASYGTSLPSSGTTGQIFFKLIS